jgi:hypothetical protein
MEFEDEAEQSAEHVRLAAEKNFHSAMSAKVGAAARPSQPAAPVAA